MRQRTDIPWTTRLVVGVEASLLWRHRQVCVFIAVVMLVPAGVQVFVLPQFGLWPSAGITAVIFAPFVWWMYR